MGGETFLSLLSSIKSIGKVLGIALQAPWEGCGDQKQCDRGRTELSVLQASSQASVCVP